MGRRIACVDVPTLPLQVLLHERPRWRGAAVAVIGTEGPDAPLTYVNARAYQLRLRPGMRQAMARNLVPELRIGFMPPSRIQEEVLDLVTAFQTFSPRVEADPRFLGAFFLDPTGLKGLYGGTKRWVSVVQRFLQGRGLTSSLVVGFERYRALAVARGQRGARVLESAQKEKELSDATRLDHFEMPRDLRRALELLGVHTLGDFLALPAGELHSRFGAEASTLHGLFAADLQLPMQPRPFDEPVRVALSIDPPDDNHERLLFAIKGGLHELSRGIALRNEAIGALQVELGLEGGSTHLERIEPAAPTRDALSLLELVRLRLSGITLPAPVEDLSLEAEPAHPEAQQLRLMSEGGQRSRDPGAANRALARIRATWGPRSVVQAKTRDAHLPEAGFQWVPLQKVTPPRSFDGDERGRAVLVRRVLPKPVPLSPNSAREPEAGPALSPNMGTLLRLYGPYRISGAWWVREVERDYYYAETGSGALLWLYFDRPRKRWFLHGMVD